MPSKLVVPGFRCRQECIVIISCYLILVAFNVYGECNKPHEESVASDTLLRDEARLFCEVSFTIHGIAFDNRGLMYVGGGKKIYTITPDRQVQHFITLNDTTENTIIWSLRFGPDQALYVAARDRVFRVSQEGEQRVIIKEPFPGPAGVTDLRFDLKGDLLLVYDNVVAKYDSDYRKHIIIDGSQFEPPLEWLVGIEFDSHFKKLYLGDCRGKKACVIPYLSENDIGSSNSFQTNWGQYFARDNSGNVYITSLGTEATFPDFVMFTPDERPVDIYSKNRVPQNQENHKKAMAWGKEGFNEDAIYCIIGSSIYEYDLKGTSQVQVNRQSGRFRDGLYLNTDMLGRNSPISSTWIEADLNTDDRDFYRDLTRADEIVFYDDNGIRTYVATDSIWGYCHKGDLHINLYGDFHRIDYVGSISHFIARKSTFMDFEIRGSHPNTIHFLTVEAVAKKTAYLVDLVNDKVSVFNVANLERILEEDPQLLNEFLTLKKRKKEKQKYVFLQRYNEKHPLIIPFK